MSQVFKGQSLLEIRLDTKYSLSGASNFKILYVKPDGTKGEWTGNVSGTEIVYQVAANDIDMPGNWQVQAYFEKDGRKAYGTIRTIQFTENLKS